MPEQFDVAAVRARVANGYIEQLPDNLFSDCLRVDTALSDIGAACDRIEALERERTAFRQALTTWDVWAFDRSTRLRSAGLWDDSVDDMVSETVALLVHSDAPPSSREVDHAGPR